VVPGAGFGTYLAEVLAEHALRTIDQPQKVSLTSLASGRTSKSPGVTASSQAVLASGSWRFRSGTLVTLRVGRAVETSETSSHLTLHTGDLFALRRTTAATDTRCSPSSGCLAASSSCYSRSCECCLRCTEFALSGFHHIGERGLGCSRRPRTPSSSLVSESPWKAAPAIVHRSF
jgi:hypothetical protein